MKKIKLHTAAKAATTIGLFCIQCSAEENIYTIISKAFPSASPLLIIVIGSVSILILGCVVAWEIFKTDRRKREKVELSWHNFGEQAVARHLSTEETGILKAIVLAGDYPQPDVIFSAPAVYDKCLATFLDIRKRSGKFEELPFDVLRVLRMKLDFARLSVETHLTSTRQISAGIPVTLKIGKNGKFLKGIINEVTEKVWIIRLADILDAAAVQSGDNLTTWFIRAGDAEYRIQTEVLGAGEDLVILEHTLNLQRKQLRNWVRVDVNIPCQTRLVSPLSDVDSKQENSTKETLDGRIMDISGGGMCLLLGKSYASNSTLLLNFNLPGAILKGVKAKVIGYNPGKGSEKDLFVHRLKFDDIEISLQEKIVRFVFEKNRMDTQFRQ